MTEQDGGTNRRRALVTGGAGGIGRATIARLLAADMNVAMVDLDPQGLQRSADSLAAAPGRLHQIAANVTQPQDVARAVADAMDAFGRIDVLVNIWVLI